MLPHLLRTLADLAAISAKIKRLTKNRDTLPTRYLLWKLHPLIDTYLY